MSLAPLALALHVVGQAGRVVTLRSATVANPIRPYMIGLVTQIAMFVVYLILLATGVMEFDVDAVPLSVLPTLIIGSIALVSMVFTNIQALRFCEAGDFAVVYALRIVWLTIGSSIFLGQETKPLEMLGGLIILTSVIILNYHQRLRIGKGTLLATLSSLLMATATMLERYHLNVIEGPSPKLPGTYLGLFIPLALVIFMIAALVFEKERRAQLNLVLTKKGLQPVGFTLLGGFMWLFSIILYPVALAGYISSTGATLTVIAGIIFLGETNNLKRKLAAAALSTLGIFVIYLAN